jgi:hypothetical protein
MAFIRGTTKEGMNGAPDDLGGESSFEDRTELIGEIYTFDKQMHYQSGFSP